MPLDELLALYGYESSDPISEQESEGGDAAPTLPDMTLDKVSGSLPVRAPGRRLAALSGRRAGGMPGPGYGSYSVIKCDGCSPAPSSLVQPRDPALGLGRQPFWSPVIDAILRNCGWEMSWSPEGMWSLHLSPAQTMA